MQRLPALPKLPLLAALTAGIAVMALLYGPRLRAPLVWDDKPTIVLNSALEKDIPFRAYFSPDYFSFSKESTWRPLATYSYSALVRAFGKNPAPLRAAMLLLHLLNACLLFSVLRRAAVTAPVALAAASLFLVHPAHSETLLCVSFNEEILAAFGILAMLAAHQRGWRLAAALAFALALLSKETGLVGVVLLPLYDAAFRGKAAVRRHVKTYLLLAATAAAYGWARFGPLQGIGGVEGPALPLGERLYYSLAGLAAMARVLVLPVRLRIEYFALPPDSWIEGALMIAGGLAAAVGLAWLLRRAVRKDPAQAFFLAWPILFWLPVSGLAPAGVLSLRLTAERWLYLPALGAAAAAAKSLPRKWIGLALVFWFACGAVRVRDWSSDSALWESLAHVYPWSAKAQEGLGEAYWRVGSYAHAQAAFEKALELRETRQDKILAHYVPRTRELRWESPSLYRWLALSHLKDGETEQAMGFLVRAQAVQPDDGFTYRALAYLCAATRDWGAARAWISAGLENDPRDEFLLRLSKDAAVKRLSFRAEFN